MTTIVAIFFWLGFLIATESVLSWPQQLLATAIYALFRVGRWFLQITKGVSRVAVLKAIAAMVLRKVGPK